MNLKTRVAVVILFQLLCVASLVADGQESPYQANKKVSVPTRIDWVYPLANQSPQKPPADWLRGYESTEQTYELFVPEKYDRKKSYAVVLFISPSAKAMGFRHFRVLCRERDVIFAGPHNAGNNCATPERVRTVLDVLDDVRRQFNVDPDRTYVGGFSGGGRIACSIAFALPEFFGGAIPICAAGDLREESWLRQRVIDRVSVAHLTGDSDFNRGEVERFRGPMLAEVGVRSRVWVAPNTGHAIPKPETLREAFDWLDLGVANRIALAKDFPASRAGREDEFNRAEWAKRLFSEGKSRLQNPKTRYSGLMQLKGVLTRWPDLPQAAESKSILLEIEKGGDQIWQREDIAEQRRFLIARARALDAYATGPLPKQYQGQRESMAKAAIDLWKIVVDDGQNTKAVAEARTRIPKLEELLPEK